MFAYKKLAVIALALLFAVPSVSMAGSFVTSLVQGKSPAEAVQVIGEQLEVLLGRVDNLEQSQAESIEAIDRLTEENQRLQSALDGKADVAIPKDQTPECLALRAQIEAVEGKNNGAIDVLADRIRPLKQELAEAKRGEVSAQSQDQGDPASWQDDLERARERSEELERQINDLNEQIDTLQEQSQEAVAPLLKKAQKDGCLRG